MPRGDSTALHHRLAAVTDRVGGAFAPLSGQGHLPGGRFCAGVSAKINSVSDADSSPHGHLKHGAAAEGCRKRLRLLRRPQEKS